MADDQNRDETIRATRDGMKRAEKHANPLWKAAAMRCIHQKAKEKKFFTTDDVHLLLDKEEAKTHNLSALGPMMKNAQKEGWIEKVERVGGGGKVRSKRVVSHGVYRPVWRSLIYENAEPEGSAAVRIEQSHTVPMSMRWCTARREPGAGRDVLLQPP